jgi:hypothetical protein
MSKFANFMEKVYSFVQEVWDNTPDSDKNDLFKDLHGKSDDSDVIYVDPQDD